MLNGDNAPHAPESLLPPGLGSSVLPGALGLPDPEDEDLLPVEEQAIPEEVAEDEDEYARAFLAGGAFATVAIDRYDDLPAIFGKIDSAASPRVALVAARGNRELQRALSMRRLQRHLDLTGKDLILVTRSRALRLRAREEALPAVGSLRRVNFQTYGRTGLRVGALRIPLPSLGAILGLLALIVAVGGAVAAIFWYLPTARVTIFVPATTSSDSFDLVLDGQVTAVNPEGGVVPARRREVVVTRSVYRPATGVTQVPNERAGVGLRFTNRTNAPLVVPRGTVAVANNGVKFTVADDVNLPRLNATGDAIALAQQPGTVGNVPANTVVQIEGELTGRVAVTNPAPGERGTDTPQQVVSEADVAGVRDFVEPILVDAAIQDLLLRYAETSTVFGSSARVEIIEIKSNPAVNAPGKYADVQVTGRVSILTAEDVDLQQVYVNRFRGQMSPDMMLLEDRFATNIVHAGAPEASTDRLPVTVEVTAVISPLLDRSQLQERLAGESRKGVEEIILRLVDTPMPPSVDISPSWMPFLPRKTDRIAIIIEPSPIP